VHFLAELFGQVVAEVFVEGIWRCALRLWRAVTGGTPIPKEPVRARRKKIERKVRR
jgi:hypothetical protein